MFGDFILSQRIASRFVYTASLTEAANRIVPQGWWLSGGISNGNCAAAYQAIGAADYATSKVNLNSPGTNDATEGVAPTFSSVDGWNFNGTTQYLRTGLVPGSDWTVIVRISGVINDGYKFGINKNTSSYLLAESALFGLVQHANGGNSLITGSGLAAGVLGVTRDGGYRNGTLETVAFSDPTVTNDLELVIGARNRDGIIELRYAGKIQALCVYNIRLNATQVSAVSTAMAAL